MLDLQGTGGSTAVVENSTLVVSTLLTFICCSLVQMSALYTTSDASRLRKFGARDGAGLRGADMMAIADAAHADARAADAALAAAEGRGRKKRKVAMSPSSRTRKASPEPEGGGGAGSGGGDGKSNGGPVPSGGLRPAATPVTKPGLPVCPPPPRRKSSADVVVAPKPPVFSEHQHVGLLEFLSYATRSADYASEHGVPGPSKEMVAHLQEMILALPNLPSGF